MDFHSKTLKDEFGRPLRTRGELLKKGGSRSSGSGSMRASFSGRRNWQMRFFWLDIDRGELRYYDDSTMAVQKGLVQLTPESEVRQSVPSLKGRHAKNATEDELNYFELTACKDDKGVLRDGPFQIRANSAQELEEWVMSIEFSLKLIRFASNQVSIDDLNIKDSGTDAAYLAELAEALKRRQAAPAPAAEPATPRQRPSPPPPPPPGRIPKTTQLFVVQPSTPTGSAQHSVQAPPPPPQTV